MENREDILKELEQISMAVATIGNENVFVVPENYFDTLAEDILEKIQAESLPVSPVPYSTPAGYFGNLADDILSKIQAQEKPVKRPAVFEELEEAAPLLNTISKSNVYAVADSYFDNLTDGIQDKIKLQEITTGRPEVFEELEEIAPLLNTISRKNVYTVPAEYFQQFSVSVDTVEEEMQPAKVVLMKRFKPRWISYLAAACLAGALVTGAFLFKGNDSTHGYINTPVDIEKGVASVSDDEINNYLNDHPAINPEVAPSVLDQATPDEIQPTIENMSTDSIKQYLKENSEPGEKRVTDI